ncbi:MAG: glutamine amidotransferase-related protein [Candidatus Heimdallarchaeaceae archaeon]
MEALKHAAAHNNAKVIVDFISTENYEENPEAIHELLKFDGILVPGGFGSRGVEGKIKVIQYARENKIPLLGICFGFQLIVVEFARHICGLEGANSTEVDPDTPHPVIDILPEQKEVEEKGGTMRLGNHKIILKENTIFSEIYQSNFCVERHRHRYEVNPDYIEQLEKHNLIFSGMSEDGRRMETLELKDHSCLIATQFHPEFTSRPQKPSPPYYRFISCALKRRLDKD